MAAGGKALERIQLERDEGCNVLGGGGGGGGGGKGSGMCV